MLNKCKEINRFYRSQAWKQARFQRIVEANGKCERCGAEGYEVHHLKPLTPENINDPEITLNQMNLILLCKDCHNKEHQRFKKSGQVFDADGNLIGYPPRSSIIFYLKGTAAPTSKIRGAHFFKIWIFRNPGFF